MTGESRVFAPSSPSTLLRRGGLRSQEPWSVALLATALIVLSGCRAAAPPESPPRPVLVVRADQTAVGDVAAFAGEVRAREEMPLSFRVGGKLVRRHVDVGARVHRGDVLAELDPSDLQLQADAGQAQLAAAEAQLVRARADHARLAALAKDQLVSRSALDQQTAALRAAEGQMRAARAQRDVARNQSGYTRLLAPRDGVIASRQAEAGQVVAVGQSVFALAADSGREVAFALPEAGIRDYFIGQQAVVEVWSAPGQRWPGRIREIAAAADPATRTYAARVVLDEEGAAKVDLGQSARVLIGKQTTANSALQVPLTAVQAGGQGAATLWVVDLATHRAKRVPVRIGPYGADRVSVLSGLKPSDWLVVAGGHLLREGQAVLPVDRSNRPVKPN